MSLGVHRRDRVHLLRAVLLDEAVRQHHRAEPQAPVEHPLLGEELRHVAAEAADRALLDGDQRLVVAPRARGSAPGRAAWRTAHPPPSAGCRARPAPRPPSGTRPAARRRTGSQPPAPPARSARARSPAARPCSGSSTPTPSPRGKRKALGRSSIATAVATMCTSSASSAAAITTKSGQAGEIGHVERPGVGRPVRAHQPGPVDGEAHRQPLDRHVVHHLVVAPLQEGRVDRRERLHPRRRHPGAEGHRMLLGDARRRSTAAETARRTDSSPVPSGIAAVTATIRSSRSASRISDCAKTLV